MFVIFFVAANALFGCLFEHGTFVAVFAFDFGMLAKQGETASVVVEFGGFLPAALAVAGSAILAKRLFVFVIPNVARVTVLVQLNAVQMTGMTATASGTSVLAPKHILGVRIVIECGRFPKIHSVAGLAFVTKLTLMAFGAVVVFLVATDTCARRFLVVAGFMAICTLHIGMFTCQSKAGCRVVKSCFFPIDFVVTICALCAERTLVNVVFAMAGIALAGCFTELFA